jgi:hypothetical protein
MSSKTVMCSRIWTGELADALRQALRMTNESFADYLGAAPRTVAYWRKRPDMVPLSAMQQALDRALAEAPDSAKAQFALLAYGPTAPEPCSESVILRIPFDSMTSHVWTRDDSQILSASFDVALADASVEAIERLAHVWLISEPPQAIELSHGRRISESLVDAVEHRVIQVRRADDFITGAASHDLVRAELRATTKLLNEAEMTETQARRLLTAVAELAQLGAWIAADGGLLAEAGRYVRGGVLAARAASDMPLAANVLSTYSYQIANNGNPNDAAILARTAYQGGQRDATPYARALLLERVAWASAKANDRQSCERALSAVDEEFSRGTRDSDPDWLYWLNQQEVEVMAGRCYTELRKPSRAASLLTTAIGGYDQSLIRENALYMSWLAEDYAQLEDIDQAADLGTRVAELASRTSSARTRERLNHIAELLSPYRESAAAQEFFEAYSSVGSA